MTFHNICFSLLKPICIHQQYYMTWFIFHDFSSPNYEMKWNDSFPTSQERSKTNYCTFHRILNSRRVFQSEIHFQTLLDMVRIWVTYIIRIWVADIIRICHRHYSKLGHRHDSSNYCILAVVKYVWIAILHHFAFHISALHSISTKPHSSKLRCALIIMRLPVALTVAIILLVGVIQVDAN